VPSVGASVISLDMVRLKVCYQIEERTFCRNFFAEVCKTFQTHKVNTSSYHPRTDGLVERFNSTLRQSLSMYVAKDQKD